MQALQSVLAIAFLIVSSSPWAADGLVATKSPHKAKDTMDRLESIVTQKGMTVFVRVDHAAGAAKVGKTLRPTELLIFGNPKGGTPFMECSQTVGIDLPLKALVWEDPSGNVWLAYNDPAYIAARHGVADCPVVSNMKKALQGFVQEATAP